MSSVAVLLGKPEVLKGVKQKEIDTDIHSPDIVLSNSWWFQRWFMFMPPEVVIQFDTYFLKWVETC